MENLKSSISVEIETLQWVLTVIKENDSILHPYWKIEKRLLALQEVQNAQKKM